MRYVHLKTGKQYNLVELGFKFKHQGTWQDAIRYKNDNNQGFARTISDFNKGFAKADETAKCSKGHHFIFNKETEKGMGYVQCPFCDDTVTQKDIVGTIKEDSDSSDT